MLDASWVHCKLSSPRKTHDWGVPTLSFSSHCLPYLRRSKYTCSYCTETGTWKVRGCSNVYNLFFFSYNENVWGFSSYTHTLPPRHCVLYCASIRGSASDSIFNCGMLTWYCARFILWLLPIKCTDVYNNVEIAFLSSGQESRQQAHTPAAQH